MKHKLMMDRRFVLLGLALLILFFSSFVLSAGTDKYSVSGNFRVSDKTIMLISGLLEDRVISSGSVNTALKKLNNSGLFSEVKIKLKGERVYIEVQENPVISDVIFEGNKVVSDEDLFRLIKSSSSNAYSKETVLADINTLIDFYKSKGRFLSVIHSEFIRNEDISIKLIFNIEEGDLLEVGEVIFVGNEAFSDRKLMSVTPSRKKGFFSFITDADNYSENMLLRDRIELERFYKSKGYIDIRITSAVGMLSVDKKSIVLSYKVSEGIRYVLGEINFDMKDLDLDKNLFRSIFTLKTGEIYNKDKLDTLVTALEQKVVLSGMPLAKVRLVVKKVSKVGVIDLDVVFDNDQKLFVEKIEIRGNNQTHDRVIRREFDLLEGDAFNPLMLRKTKENLQALGFFQKVSMSVKAGKSKEKAIVIVEVVEAPTGSLNFGVGYSTDTSVTGSLSVTERNLLGKGQKLNFNLSASKSSQTLNFGFTEPSFLNRDVAAGLNLDFKKVDPSESTYTSNSISLSPSLGFMVGPNSKMMISYKVQNLKINSQDSLSSVLRGDHGDYVDSSVNSTLVYDKRNSIVEPTGGYILRLSSTLSGLGGNTGFVKNSVRGKLYKGVFNNSVIFSAELEGGNLSSFRGVSRVTDRFKLGGRNFRGFQFGEIGPRDITGDALGGEKYIISRIEANFPLGLPEELGLYGGVFSELGSLWSLRAKEDVVSSISYSDKSYRSSAGVSLYWTTPIGPLQFNWSKPIDYIEGVDVTENFSLNLATRF